MRLLLPLFLSLILLLTSCSTTENVVQPAPNDNNQEPLPTELPKEMTPELCESARGKWTECGSPCAGMGEKFCIEMCEEMCQCGGIAGFGCPDGYHCRLSGKIADEMGKCVPN